MLGSLGSGDAIIGRDVEASLDALLKLAARVDMQLIFDNVIQQFQQGRLHEIDDGAHALIEVEGADDGFKGAAENRQAFAAPAQFFAMPDSQICAQAQIHCELRQRIGLDQGGAQLCQLAFVDLRELAI